VGFHVAIISSLLKGFLELFKETNNSEEQKRKEI
jgi:hypothetical protein